MGLLDCHPNTFHGRNLAIKQIAWITFAFLSLAVISCQEGLPASVPERIHHKNHRQRVSAGVLLGQEDLISLCRSSASRQSCGQCIKQSPECVWCTDPAFAGDYRCDVESNLIDSCPPQFLYQAKSNVRVKENVEAGAYEQNVGRIRRIQPQVVHLFIKPGESVSFPIKYYHVEEDAQDIHVLNSETESHGVSLVYSVDCKGIKKQDRSCTGVRNADLITYNVTVSIRGCSSNAVVSIGITNVREVIAVYVHPQCGCDCERPEKQEPKSAHCSGSGTLICGACICENPRLGGRHCECPLAEGLTTAKLEDYCRPSPDKAICTGHGYCNCGYCVCDQQYSGRFCDCAYAPCPTAENGHLCGGRGSCHCGQCQCEPGWEGPTCTCSIGTEDCLSADGKICSGRGRCFCNKCTCVDGYEGERCENIAGQSPQTARTVEAHPEDDGDDQDDDDDDDDHEEATTAAEVTESHTDGDHEQQTVEQPHQEAEAEPEPEPEPSSEKTSDDGGTDHSSTEHITDVEATAEPHKESGSTNMASPKCALSLLTVLLSFVLVSLVNGR